MSDSGIQSAAGLHSPFFTHLPSLIVEMNLRDCTQEIVIPPKGEKA